MRCRSCKFFVGVAEPTHCRFGPPSVLDGGNRSSYPPIPGWAFACGQHKLSLWKAWRNRKITLPQPINEAS